MYYLELKIGENSYFPNWEFNSGSHIFKIDFGWHVKKSSGIDQKFTPNKLKDENLSIDEINRKMGYITFWKRMIPSIDNLSDEIVNEAVEKMIEFIPKWINIVG